MTKQSDRFENLLSAAVADGRQIVVGGIIFNEHGEILLLRRASGRQFLPCAWDLPGGHARKGEKLADALRREIAEETGWELCSIDDLIMVSDWEQSSGSQVQPKREFDFVVTVKRTGACPVYNAGEFSEHFWLPETETGILMQNRDPQDNWLKRVTQNAFSWRKNQQ